MSVLGHLAIFDHDMTVRTRSSLHRWLQPLLASLLLLTFGSNSALPGLLHGCGEPQASAESVEMAGMHHESHQGHDAPSGPAAPCACVDHGCCAVAVVLPAPALIVAPATIEVVASTPLFATDLAPPAPSFLQPYPIGPPISA